jgi:O-antigen ligase
LLYNEKTVDLEKIFKLIIWNALIVFIIVYPLQYLVLDQPLFMEDYNRGERFYGAGIHPVPLSFFMVIVLYSAIFLFEKNQQKRYLLVALASSIFLILTYGRTAIAGFFLTFLVYLYYKKKLKYAIPLAIIVLIFSFTIIVNFFLIKGQIYQDNADFVSSGRLGLWEESIKSFLKHPILGVGAGSSDIVMQSFNLNTPHNEFIRVLIEIGIIGLIMFLIYILLQFKSLFSNARENPVPWAIFLFFILTLILDNSLDYNIFFTFQVFVILGITNRLNSSKDKTRRKHESIDARN